MINQETASQKTDRLLEEACNQLRDAVREKQSQRQYGLITVEATMSAGDLITVVFTEGKSFK